MMPATTKNKSTTVLLSIAAIVGAIAIISAMFISSASSQKTAFFARSINDASYDCEDKINSYFDDELISKYYDDISSRYEANDHQYIIYYRVSAREMENDFPVIYDYMAKCVVWEKLGYVSSFRAYRI